MRIAYVFNNTSPRMTGIFKKIARQAGAWLDLGLDVKVFLMMGRSATDYPDPIREVDPRIPKVLIRNTNLVDVVLSRSYRVGAAVIKWKPDIVYARHGLYDPSFMMIARRHPTVLEVNTDDIAERKGMRDTPVYNYCTRWIGLSRCAGMVFVTGELSTKKHFARFRKPFVVIGNGIDLSQYDPLPVPRNKQPRLVFMGSGAHYWFGLDKLIEMARLFPEWSFDVVGSSHSDLSDDIPTNMTLHGLLGRHSYEPIMAQADVAVGTLALHRIEGMNEASPMKVREYLALGIPTIIGFKDTDFPDPPQFILQLPNIPENVAQNYEKIRHFVETMKGQRVPRDQIAHIDSRAKELLRIEFFEKLMGHSQSSRD